MKGHIAIIYMNLGPYHLARLKALSQSYPLLVAIEVSAKQRSYPWRPEKSNISCVLETLFNEPLEEVSVRDQKRAMVSCLGKHKPGSVIVSGYSDPVMRAATRWARRRRVQDILLFSTTESDRQRIWWREWIKSRFVRQFQSLAVTGAGSAQYAHKLGVPKGKIFTIGNVVDNERCQDLAKSFQETEPELRKKLNLPQHFFLSVGRLSKEKNLAILLQSFMSYRKSGGTWDLVLVGSGPEEKNLKQIALASKNHIQFTGWKQFDELMAYYALANCLVLPSMSEAWGLVVNEAMACGLPVLVSEKCGCAPELCKNGMNGHTFHPQDVEGLASLMLSYSRGKFDLEKMGAESRRIIGHWTPESWAEGLLHAINTKPN